MVFQKSQQSQIPIDKEGSHYIYFDPFDNMAFAAKKIRFYTNEMFLIKRDQPQLNKTIKIFSLKLFDCGIC